MVRCGVMIYEEFINASLLKYVNCAPNDIHRRDKFCAVSVCDGDNPWAYVFVCRSEQGQY